MNNRILELMDSVGLGIRHDGIVLTKNVTAAEALEQFVQLIVKDCATTAYQHDPVNPVCTEIADEIYQRMVIIDK